MIKKNPVCKRTNRSQASTCQDNWRPAIRKPIAITWLVAAALLAVPWSEAWAGVLNDYNPYNVDIPDNGSSVNTDLSLSGAPTGAVITNVKVYYEIRHTYPGDLDVWLTAYYSGSWHDHWLYHYGDLGSADNIIETRDNIHTFDGVSPNQTWYLAVRDRASGDVGYIDFFEMWVTYATNEPPNEPSNEDPTPRLGLRPEEGTPSA